MSTSTPTWRLHRLGVALASTIATFTAITAFAFAGETKPRFVDEPFLGRLSNGAALNYSLDRRVEHQHVTIAGRRTKVKLVDRATNSYTAFLVRSGLERGRKYRVTVKVRTRSGTRAIFSDRLYLHRSTSRPAESN